MNIFNDKETLNISSVQFALSNFFTIDNNDNCGSLNEILVNFKNKRDSWIESECLFNSNDETQIFFGLTILIDFIRFKWTCISSEQQECISNFILGKVLKLSLNLNTIQSDEVVLRKFNHCLIEIFFSKWANNEWDNFIDDLIQSCHANEYLCLNNLLIFKTIYEMIYTNELNVNLSKEKMEKMKSLLSSVFDKILKLILSIIDVSRNVTLVVRSLDLLELFICIKSDFIKDYDKIFSHLSTLLLVSILRRDATKTILSLCRYIKSSNKVVEYLKVVLEQLTKIIPSAIVLKDIFADCKSEDQSFLILIADLLSEFIIEFYHDNSYINFLEEAWLFLLRLTAIENDDIGLICFDYWSQLSDMVYYRKLIQSDENFYSKATIYLNEVSEVIVSSHCSSATNSLHLQESLKNEHSFEYLEPKFQFIQNTYRNVFKLNPKTSIEQIKIKFNNLLTSPNVPIRELYMVCRSIDFIFLDEEIQRKVKFNMDHELIDLLIDLIRYSFNSLLSLQGQMLTFKDQIPISCAMIYLIGSFGVFGNVHIELSQAMLKRLFQFFLFGNELLKNMAIDSFKKWALLNSAYFINNMYSKGKTILNHFVSNIGSRSISLNTYQLLSFHEHVITIISAIEDSESQNNYIILFFKQPNEAWLKIYERITEDVTILLDSQVLSNIRNIIELNIRACKHFKTAFNNQLTEICQSFIELLNLMSLSLSRISRKCCNGTELYKPPLSCLIVAHDISLLFVETFTKNISWNNENFVEVSKVFIPILMSDYTRLSMFVECAPILNALQAILESGEVPWANVATVITRIIPPSQSFVEALAFEDIKDSCNILYLIRSITRSYVPIITNSTLFPFIELIHVIDFVLWGLKAILNNTRQICYSILEMILQYFETDKVNSHQRKKFIRQFYMHIIQTVLISSLDGIRNLDDDTFVSVVLILNNWVSSSFISFRLNKSDRKKSKQCNLQQTIDANKDHITKHLLILLTSIYPHMHEIQHAQFVSGILRASNIISINDIIREYRRLSNQYVVERNNEDMV